MQGIEKLHDRTQFGFCLAGGDALFEAGQGIVVSRESAIRALFRRKSERNPNIGFINVGIALVDL